MGATCESTQVDEADVDAADAVLATRKPERIRRLDPVVVQTDGELERLAWLAEAGVLAKLRMVAEDRAVGDVGDDRRPRPLCRRVAAPFILGRLHLLPRTRVVLHQPSERVG